MLKAWVQPPSIVLCTELPCDIELLCDRESCIVLCIELLCDRQSCIEVSALVCPACDALTLQSFFWLSKGGYMPMEANRPSALLLLCQWSSGSGDMNSWSADCHRSMQGHRPKRI